MKHTKEREGILEGNGWPRQRRSLTCRCNGERYRDVESGEWDR